MSNSSIDPSSNIIWVDSDRNVCHSTNLFRAQNYRVACFHETADALEAVNERRLEIGKIDCIITSMMERDGRKERGCLNGLQMLDEMKQIWKRAGICRYPLTAVISLTADVRKCKAHGVDIVVLGNHQNLQVEVIDQLKKRLNNAQRQKVILIGIAGPSGCGKTTYAKHLATHLQSPFLPISLDRFFINPINIDHPVLGPIPSLEQPESININAFLTLLYDIKTQGEQTPLERSNITINNHKVIYVVIEGFLLFALTDQVTSMFDIRIFLNSSQSRCRMQRFRRASHIDQSLDDSQVKITDKFRRWYDHLVWNEYLKRCDQQKANSEKVFEPEDYQNKDYTKLDAYIDTRLELFV